MYIFLEFTKDVARIHHQKSSATKLFVAAIDIGTSYSNYAFSNKADWAKVCASDWTGGKLISNKVLTAILLNSDKTFNCFGYDAEAKYFELAEEKEHTEYFYFHRFKKALEKHKVIYLILCLCVQYNMLELKEVIVLLKADVS